MRGADVKPRKEAIMSGAIGNMWQLVHNQGKIRHANHKLLSTDATHETHLLPQPELICCESILTNDESLQK